MSTEPTPDGGSEFLENGEAQGIPPKRTYLCLTMFTCFCPAWPINIVAFVFSVLAQNSYEERDYDGSMHLGRKALHLGTVSLILGLVIISAYIIVHFSTHVV